MKLRIDAQVELIACKGAAADASEWCKLRSARLNRKHPTLIVALVAGEEEGTVFAKRSTDLIAELATLEERIRIGGITGQGRISGQVGITIKIKEAAVKLMATRARHDVDRAVRCQAGRNIEVNSRNLELLHD